jgi:hypothetical protein
MRSHSDQSHNLFLPQRSQPKQNRNGRLWLCSHPNRTRNLPPR